jgi:hypothetical protein
MSFSEEGTDRTADAIMEASSSHDDIFGARGDGAEGGDAPGNNMDELQALESQLYVKSPGSRRRDEESGATAGKAGSASPAIDPSTQPTAVREVQGGGRYN